MKMKLFEVRFNTMGTLTIAASDVHEAYEKFKEYVAKKFPDEEIRNLQIVAVKGKFIV